MRSMGLILVRWLFFPPKFRSVFLEAGWSFLRKSIEKLFTAEVSSFVISALLYFDCVAPVDFASVEDIRRRMKRNRHCIATASLSMRR